MKIAVDIETDLDQTCIWCVSVYDGQKCYTYTEPTDEFKGKLHQASTVIGHNIIAFDWYWLEQLWGVVIPFEKLQDTMLLSRLYNPELKHSLAEWGKRLGDNKGDFTDFNAGYSEEMRIYCEQDTKLTYKLYEHIKAVLASESFSEASQELEHQVARVVAQQERNGFLFHSEAAERLYERLSRRMQEITNILQEKFPPIVHKRYSEKTGKPLKDYVEVFNIGSRKQIAERLQSIGVKFKQKTAKGSIIVDEKTLEGIDIPEAQLIQEYLLLQKRTSHIDSWLKAVGDDGRIHGKVITNGAVTSRMTHFSPNLAQIPSVNAPYGAECRALFGVEDDNVLVGADASGLELRMLAHYMKDADYIQEILSGDVHTANMKAAGIESRADAKTFIYAFLYGAGAAKIGSIVGGNFKTGEKLIERFLNNTPALKTLKTKVTQIAASGSVPGLDGRRLRIRSEHASLNTLLQGAGAIVMKKALVILSDKLQALNIPNKFVANIHDEWQIETPEHYGKAVGINAVRAIREAGDALELRCPLDGEYKVGKNWEETH